MKNQKNTHFEINYVKLVPELAAAISEIINEKNLSLKQVSKIVGIDKNTLQKFLLGQEKLPLEALKPFNKIGIPIYEVLCLIKKRAIGSS